MEIINGWTNQFVVETKTCEEIRYKCLRNGVAKGYRDSRMEGFRPCDLTGSIPQRSSVIGEFAPQAIALSPLQDSRQSAGTPIALSIAL